MLKLEVPEVAEPVKAGGNYPKSVKARGNKFGYLRFTSGFYTFLVITSAFYRFGYLQYPRYLLYLQLLHTPHA